MITKLYIVMDFKKYNQEVAQLLLLDNSRSSSLQCRARYHFYTGILVAVENQISLSVTFFFCSCLCDLILERDRLKPAPPPKPAGLAGQPLTLAPQRNYTLNVTPDYFSQLRVLQKQSRDLRIEVYYY